ncbi:MAG: transposase [Deltaproteobacteria bacterium]|nr:transposase [Deltaproteobacteria bacterium]
MQELTLTNDGKYLVALKREWAAGTCAIVFSGAELMARLAVLVPPPRVHTTRYFGVWAPRSKMRRLVTPCSPAPGLIYESGSGPVGANFAYDLFCLAQYMF